MKQEKQVSIGQNLSWAQIGGALAFMGLLLWWADPFSSSTSSKPLKKVAITQIVEHAALNRTREGVADGLKKEGFEVEIVYENAQGNLVTAVQIIQGFVSQNPDVIVAISTPSAQTALTGAPNIPVVFAAVSNPEAAGLLHPSHRHHVTGTIDLPPLKEQLAYFKTLLPHLKRVGVIYSGGEANSVAFLTALKAVQNDYQIQVVESAVTRTSDVSSAAAHLIAEGVDAILLPQDNTVVSALDTLVNVTQEARVPLLTTDSELVGKGAFAAIGYSHYDTGLATAKVVAKVLSGVSPESIPVELSGKLEQLVNGRLVRAWSIALPKNIKVKIVE